MCITALAGTPWHQKRSFKVPTVYSMNEWLILSVLLVNGYNVRVCICVLYSHHSSQVVKHRRSLLSPTIVEHSNYNMVLNCIVLSRFVSVGPAGGIRCSPKIRIRQAADHKQSGRRTFYLHNIILYRAKCPST